MAPAPQQQQGPTIPQALEPLQGLEKFGAQPLAASPRLTANGDNGTYKWTATATISPTTAGATL